MIRRSYKVHLTPSTSPVLSGLVLGNLGIHPFNNIWKDDHTATMAFLCNYGRCLSVGWTYDKNSCYTAVMAELIGPLYLPQEIFLDEARARRMFIVSVRALISNDAARNQVCQGFNEAAWTTLIAQQGCYALAQEYVRDFGNAAAADYRCEDLNSAIRILYHLARHATQEFILTGPELIVNIMVAIYKRGTISANDVFKVTSGIKRDFGYVIELKAESVTTFYRTYVSRIIDDTIVLIPNRWFSLIPQGAQSLSVRVQQLVGSQLSSYILIGTALRLYSDFKWAAIARVFPEEWKNYDAALTAVGHNSYYGFRRDLGPARPIQFVNLSYVAEALLCHVVGRSLRSEIRWQRKTAHTKAIDKLIFNYVNPRPETDLNEENLVLPNDVVDLRLRVNHLPKNENEDDLFV